MKALKIVAAIVAVIVIGFVAFILTFDIGKYKGLIEQQAKAATGRDVTIGTIKMGFSLTPNIVLTDVSMANAPGGSRPQMLIVKTISAQAELMPLLSNQVNITKITMDGADVLLETDRAGKGNWEFPVKPAQPSEAAAGQSSALSVGSIEGTNMKVVVKDAKAGTETDAAVKSMSMKLVGPMQDMNVSNFTMNDMTVNQRDAANNVQATVAKIALESNGPLAAINFKKLDVESAKVVGKNGGAAVNAELSKLTLDEKGALDLTAKYNGEDIRAKGTIAGLQGLKGGGKKELPMKLALEGMGLKGDVDLVVDAGQTPAFVKGTISIPEFDAAKFAGGNAAPATGTAPAPANTAPRPAAAASKTMFSTEPLPWESLDGTNADVKVSIGTVKLADGQTIANVVLPIKLNKGVLAMNGASLQMIGGTIAGDVDANASSKAVAIRGTVKGLSAETLAKAYKLTDLVTQGPIDVAIDLRGAGASPKIIAGSLNGSFLATMGESRIRTDAMGPMAAQVLAAINPMGNKDPYTVARCAVTNFQLTNGVANTQNGVAMVTDKMSFTASGKIDLAQERVDMIVKPDAKSLVGSGLTKLVSQVKVSGPMTGPNISLDAASTVAGVAGLAVGIAGGAANGGGNILGGIAGGLFGGGKTQAAGGAKAAEPAGDICATARAWGRKS